MCAGLSLFSHELEGHSKFKCSCSNIYNSSCLAQGHQILELVAVGGVHQRAIVQLAQGFLEGGKPVACDAQVGIRVDCSDVLDHQLGDVVDCVDDVLLDAGSAVTLAYGIEVA